MLILFFMLILSIYIYLCAKRTMNYLCQH